MKKPSKAETRAAAKRAARADMRAGKRGKMSPEEIVRRQESRSRSSGGIFKRLVG